MTKILRNSDPRPTTMNSCNAVSETIKGNRQTPTPMLSAGAALLLCALHATTACGQQDRWKPDITRRQTYTLHRATSKELTDGGNDSTVVTPGETKTLLDADGPGLITHLWFTLNDSEPYHLKRIVLRMYWDGETSPSVEAPIGDFFGLGLGEYANWQSDVLSVGSSKSLNCFFPMPFRKHARVTITDEGKESINALYYNIDYRVDKQPLPADTVYFHAQFHQAQPNKGWTNQWYSNYDPLVVFKRNPDAANNYVWMDAVGSGQFIGVTMSVFQNQDGWWGEGNDEFFVDGETKPAIAGTGTEDYFLGAWNFGSPFSYATYGAPVVGSEVAGGRSSVYRFHLDAPIPFSKSLRATIEHGHANHRSDNFYSVAYWYQTEPHKPFEPLPPVDARIPAFQLVGGPGNSGANGGPTTPNR